LIKHFKKRYIALTSDPKAPPDILFRAVKSSYQELFGVLGLAQARLKLAKAYPDRGMAVLECSLESLAKLIFSTAAVTHLNGERVAVRIVAVSGTMRGIRERLRRIAAQA